MKEENGDDEEEERLKCPSCGELCLGAKFLPCLHSVCLQCVNKGLQSCPVCAEHVSSSTDLFDDFLLICQIEELNLNKSLLHCQSCKSVDDLAVAHCSTCQSYLCSQCCQAHQAMKCFEQHHVRQLQERKIRSTSSPVVNEQRKNIDEDRRRMLNEFDQRLTSMQEHFDGEKKKIELVLGEYRQELNQLGEEHLTRLGEYQREEEMRLLEQLEDLQKKSQSFDDLQRLEQRYQHIDKDQRLEQLFTNKFQQFQQIFQNNRREEENNFTQFEHPPKELFQQWLKQHFGQWIHPSKTKTKTKTKTGPVDSISSGLGSFPSAGVLSSSSPRLSNGEESPRSLPSIDQPLVDNLRALETIFAGQINPIHPNVQRNLQEMFQMTQQHDDQQQQQQHYSFLTRQTSAPPLGQRSPLGHLPPSLLTTTYSSTNSGGSSNGNNSRSTTPFSSSGTLDGGGGGILLNGGHRRTTPGQSMQVRAKFGSLGPQKCQFNAPHGFCLGIDEEIIVADTNNHRIQIFDKIGEYKYQFGIPGKEEGQLWYPRKVAVIRQSGKFVVCDRGNERSRMQIFTRNGHFIKKISIRYIDIVAGLAITQQGLFSLSQIEPIVGLSLSLGNIVAVDSVSPTVFCISESGDLLKWFDCSDYMREPSDIAIFNNEYFVCDFKVTNTSSLHLFTLDP